MSMSQSVTIVMYHYVRDLERTRFPRIKALPLERYIRQLDHLASAYTIISVEQLIDAMHEPARRLPERSALLTFDDGYSDHFQTVFPQLDRRGIPACFFPPVTAIVEHQVLDVNKIQFVLAAFPDAAALLHETLQLLEEYRSNFNLASADHYQMASNEAHRYDDAQVITFKRLLQRELPGPVRKSITHRLFEKYVTQDEAAFAHELYMTPDQMACMVRHGMHFGSHGCSHAWMERLSPQEQAAEIDRSIDFLRLIGQDEACRTMCYPYGSFNASLVELLKARNFKAGFTVEPRVADLNSEEPLLLPRLDTNDLPG